MRILCERAIHRLASFGLCAMLGISATTPELAASAGYRPQSVAIREGLAVVERAAAHDVDAAFIRAAALSRSDDSGLRARLDAQKQTVTAAVVGLGALRGVAPAEETVFAGCVTHRYLVRYEQGKQRWMLKYRRGVDGWYLSDLHVGNA